MEFAEDSFQPLLSAPVHVRWTSPAHSVLEEAVLDTISPLSEPAAGRLFALADKHVRKLYIHRREPMCEILELAAVSDGAAIAWVVSQFPKRNRPVPDDQVFVSWDNTTGVRTTWGTFSAHWRTFCHPEQDDVVVWPVERDWVLYHHHDGRLYLGV